MRLICCCAPAVLPALLGLVSLLLPTAAHAQELTPVAVGWDLVPMVGTSGWARGEDLRGLSLNIVGYAGAVDGVELGAGVNIDRLSMSGLQLSGGANLVGAGVDGVQLSGGLNIVSQNTVGVQGAGGVNLVGGGVDGLQMAGGLNVVGLGVDGVQLSGGVNIAGGAVDGVQASGGLNIAGGVVDGAQLAGGLNIASGVDGAQVAPLNYAAGHVEGIQIGVVNIARSSDFSLGVINIIWEGRTHLDTWVTEGGFAYAALKHGGEGFHYIYGVGYRPGTSALSLEDGDSSSSGTGGAPPPAWSTVLGLGSHSAVGQRFFLDTDLLTQQINEGEVWSQGLNLQSTARAVVGVQVLDRLAVMAGPTYNVLVSNTCGPKYSGPGTVVFNEGPVQVRGWPGWMLGVELL